MAVLKRIVNKKLSCIVVNRNTSGLLLKCLEHIYRSRLPEKPEVLVVDNGSTDDSVACVKKDFPEAIILEAGRNLGFAAANNWAIKHASGTFFLLVNTDAMLESDAASMLINLMESDARIGLAGPQLLNADGSVQTSYEAVPTLATETLNRSLLKRLFPKRFPHKSRVLSSPEEVESLIGAVMMIRREAIEQLGGFDERYFFFLEETDLAVRMVRNGWNVVHEPRARAAHLQGATAKKHAPEARIEFYRSRYLFFSQHYGTMSASILKAAMVANLAFNVVALGLARFVTAGRVDSVAERFRVRHALWRWHIQGCPPGPGLPRT
jgi:GT2 family glycosyltransferase